MATSTYPRRWLSPALLAISALVLRAGIVPDSRAAPLEMTPMSLNYSFGTPVLGLLTVELIAGDTLPAPEVTLRHSVTNPIFGTSGARFVYDFDVDVTGVSAFLVQDPDLHPLTGTILNAPP